MAVNMNVNDPSHELFLHPSDNPNNILVKNYGHWKKAMEVALIAKNKLGFALGTCAKPSVGSPLAGHWDRCDKMVISWIMNAVIKDIGRAYCSLPQLTQSGYNLSKGLGKRMEQGSLRFNESYAPFHKITCLWLITLLRSRKNGMITTVWSRFLSATVALIVQA